jgi:hypothetical protein
MENLADLRDYYPRIEVTVPSSESSEPTTHIAGVDSMPRPKGKRKKLTPLEEKRRSIIFGALQSNLMGRQYCIHLDHKKLPIPIVWEAEGCPDTYAKAYTDGSGRWKKRIQDEKSRYNQKYRLMSAPAREKLIQQASRARGTR